MKDLFISYAHIDDEPLFGGDGWVTSLHRLLKVRLHQLLGGEQQIWWDRRRQDENRYLVDLIHANVADSRLLAAVLSPKYANSKWCLGELHAFCERADLTGGISPEGVARLFCAVKTPLDGAPMPRSLEGLRRYEFYEEDASGRVREFAPEKDDKRYQDKFEDLARDIADALKKLRPAEGGAAADGPLPMQKKVYLAETSADMCGTRDRVMRELKERGYVVLPGGQLPASMPEFEAAVRTDLALSALSIHIIGETYGAVPDGDEELRSIVRLQHELAAGRANADPSFARLVWMPNGLQPRGAHQERFVAELQTGAGAEVLQTSFEDLKTRIIEKLEPKKESAAAEAAAARPAAPDALKRVYLICDNPDAGDAQRIDDYLYEQGYEVLRNVSEGDDAQLAQLHRDNLVNCDAALIYYGAASPAWLRLKMSDLLKAPAWGRTRPMLAKAVYVSHPETDEKRRFRTREAQVIHGFGDFSPEALRSFVGAIGAVNGGGE